MENYYRHRIARIRRSAAAAARRARDENKTHAVDSEDRRNLARACIEMTLKADACIAGIPRRWLRDREKIGG